MPGNANKINGGIGQCPSAPSPVKHKYYQLAVSKVHEKAARVVSAMRSARGCCGQRPTARGKRGHRRRRARSGKLFQKSTSEKAGSACATLFFAELPTGRRPRASTSPVTSFHDPLAEATNSDLATGRDSLRPRGRALRTDHESTLRPQF